MRSFRHDLAETLVIILIFTAVGIGPLHAMGKVADGFLNPEDPGSWGASSPLIYWLAIVIIGYFFGWTLTNLAVDYEPFWRLPGRLRAFQALVAAAGPGKLAACRCRQAGRCIGRLALPAPAKPWLQCPEHRAADLCLSCGTRRVAGLGSGGRRRRSRTHPGLVRRRTGRRICRGARRQSARVSFGKPAYRKARTTCRTSSRPRHRSERLGRRPGRLSVCRQIHELGAAVQFGRDQLGQRLHAEDLGRVVPGRQEMHA